MAHRYEKDGAFAFGVRRKESSNVVVEKGEPGGPKPLRVRGKIKLAAEDASLKLNRAIATIAEALQNGAQVGEKKDVHGRIGGQILSQPQVTGLPPESPLLWALQHSAAAVD